MTDAIVTMLSGSVVVPLLLIAGILIMRAGMNDLIARIYAIEQTSSGSRSG